MLSGGEEGVSRVHESNVWIQKLYCDPQIPDHNATHGDVSECFGTIRVGPPNADAYYKILVEDNKVSKFSEVAPYPGFGQPTLTEWRDDADLYENLRPYYGLHASGKIGYIDRFLLPGGWPNLVRLYMDQVEPRLNERSTTIRREIVRGEDIFVLSSQEGMVLLGAHLFAYDQSPLECPGRPIHRGPGCWDIYIDSSYSNLAVTRSFDDRTAALYNQASARYFSGISN